MTKYDLRNYKPTKAELDELDRMRFKLDRHATEELRTVYEEKRKALAANLKRIEDAIECLEPIERQVLRLRYIEGLEWHQVAARVHYSLSDVHRKHSHALVKLQDK